MRVWDGSIPVPYPPKRSPSLGRRGYSAWGIRSWGEDCSIIVCSPLNNQRFAADIRPGEHPDCPVILSFLLIFDPLHISKQKPNRSKVNNPKNAPANARNGEILLRRWAYLTTPAKSAAPSHRMHSWFGSDSFPVEWYAELYDWRYALLLKERVCLPYQKLRVHSYPVLQT